jgi:ABC-2 type transport system permease protein
MSKYLDILKFESFHLINSPYKIISILLYAISILYGCQTGYDLFKKHNIEIKSIKSKNADFEKKMLVQYDELEQGLIEKPRRDPTIPYWAIWNTPSYALKSPSPMIVFSTGQAEQYGYYKKVTNWSTVFDNDLAEEIANPERLALGTLDFSFVLLFLTPILLIILLFNIGGLEKDNGFDKLIYLNDFSKKSWLITRFSYYFLVLFTLICFLLIPYAVLSGVFTNELMSFFTLMVLIFLYIFLWVSIFYFINYWGKGSVDQAIKMISVWVALSIIMPGLFHQITSIKFSTNYMVDYLDVARDQRYEIFDMSTDTLQNELLESFPILKSSVYAQDTTIDKGIINRSISGLVNILNKKASGKIEKESELKNNFVRSTLLLNPIMYFQNKINEVSNADYYAYRLYRENIQNSIDKKIELILRDTWNKEEVDKERYIEYLQEFKN